MDNILRSSSNVKSAAVPLPIDTVFKLPSPPPTWPPGGGFATGEMDLGGLQVRQVTTFQKISTTYKGGPADLGATFLEPSPIPDGFTMLGSYAQPNNQPLFGWVLVAKTNAVDTLGQILKQPTDYTLISTNDDAHFWLPTPPDGFRAIGLVVTASPEKPALDKICCVRADFTDEAETKSQIWGNVYVVRGSNAKSVSVGTFTIQGNDNNTLTPLSCLINKDSALSAMPNQAQIEAVFASYAPFMYFHPREKYLPSSVNWYFSNGALLFKKGEESNPVAVLPEGSNLPQGGTNDGLYWLDLPAEPDGTRVKMGDLPSAMAYLHFKPVLGGSATDIQVWVFYPFNGPAAAKVGPFKRVELGKIGEHVGDWEHVTLRISNLDGILRRVYFAEHGGGQWVDSSELEFSGGGNRFSVYSSRNGHAAYRKAGLVVQGGDFVGLRNDAAKSAVVMDTGARFAVVAGEGVVEPPWLNYYRKWGPTRSYDTVEELKNAGKFLPGFLKKQLAKLVNGLPPEVFGEDGPIGPKMKNNWDGDEK
ncbi:hypothetical protein SASPL_149165 [Salvia splendens]|uniref:Vacuolar protein sorting-associated protein 62 n=1 Tax=Salvia splendens TaxID=180675 RepID=A0A8X8WCB0_SALSN|nr:uncharacterized protein LOC121779189 [Salvia splendens]KAG6391411.1 hypothetical protein SASPL_149165 [Salvia splendens]